MSAFAELGFARGATDKLMGRARDESPPSEVTTKSAVSAYKKAYVRGYDATVVPTPSDSVGASVSFSASASTSPKSSPSSPTPSKAPGTEGNADQGFNATLPEQKIVTRLKLPLFATKPAVAVATRQTASALGAPAPSGPMPMPTQTMPAEQLGAPPPGALPTMQLEVAPQASLTPATFADKAKAWWGENWKTVAVGTAAVVVVGGVVYVATRKSDNPSA